MTTPGPWEAVERIDGYWEVRGDHADCAEGVPLRQEDDVRLMARAPDLLAALATARAEGRRQGIEEAARRLLSDAQIESNDDRAWLESIAFDIRALAREEGK